MRIELIYFEGCPNAPVARERLLRALRASANPAPVREWRQEDPAAPAYARQYGSPTILIDGRDVTGAEPGSAAGRSCRADGAPSLDSIVSALSGRS